MTNESIAQVIAGLLAHREEKIVFAESCTAGLLSGTLATIPGISENLCGSMVTYRSDNKHRWLDVKTDTIKTFTTESQQVADEMVLGVLKYCPEADWAVSIVGHMGPNSPKGKDGAIFASFARRTKKGKLKIKDRLQYTCGMTERTRRLNEAVEAVYSQLARILHKRSKHDADYIQPSPDANPKNLATPKVTFRPIETSVTPTTEKVRIPRKRPVKASTSREENVVAVKAIAKKKSVPKKTNSRGQTE